MSRRNTEVYMTRKNRILLLAILLVLASLPILSNAGLFSTKAETVTISKEEYERLKQYEQLDEVKQYVDAFFYEEPDQKLMMEGAISGLLAGLGDAYSFYYNEEAWTKMHEDDSGKYSGIGVQMLGDYNSAAVTITRVFRNTPAEEAGLKKGDIFYMVEDLEVTTATMMDAVKIMRGYPGEKVHIEVIRNGEVLPFDLVKANITVNRTEHKMLDEKVGYLLLTEFAGDSKDAFLESYNDLLAQGMQHLIFDLRDNPGGWVSNAEGIGDLFLDKQLLYYTQDRAGSRKEYVTDKGAVDMPITVLVNGNSASASEILAAGFQDHQRATVLGEKSFGKGIIQYVIPLNDNKTGFQFTTAQYFSPLGNKVHKEGVTPDLVVEMPEELRSKMFETGDLSDPQLAAAYELALKQLAN